MRRVVLVLALVAGTVIGFGTPVSGLGLISVTLTCSDNTSVTMNVDTETLNNLTDSVNAMTLYPAGLTCSLVQNPVNPLGALFGHVALASSGSNPFIVAGGRWQAQTTCEDLGAGPPPPPPPALVAPGTVARVPGSLSYSSGPVWTAPAQTSTPVTIFVNIAVNVHQQDGGSGPFFGTLNETIPTQQVDACGPGTTISERHFTSTPNCLFTSTSTSTSGTSDLAGVTSTVTQISGGPFPGATFVGQTVNFQFVDNGNPPQPTDLLQGPPEPQDAGCTIGTTDRSLSNGNISVHNAAQ
jgi:hypothetical protein